MAASACPDGCGGRAGQPSACEHAWVRVIVRQASADQMLRTQPASRSAAVAMTEARAAGSAPTNAPSSPACCDDESNRLGNLRLVIAQPICELAVDFQVTCSPAMVTPCAQRSAGRSVSTRAARNAGLITPIPPPVRSAIFSAIAPIVDPGLTAPTVGMTLPSAMINPRDLMASPARIDKGLPCGSLPIRAVPSKCQPVIGRQGCANLASCAGCLEDLRWSAHIPSRSSPWCCRDKRVAHLHAGQAIGLRCDRAP